MEKNHKHNIGKSIPGRMPRIISGLLAVCFALLASGCAKDPGETAPEDGRGITIGDITFEIGFVPQSRVATDADFKSAWSDHDEIGLFAVVNGTELASQGNYIHNVKLTYNNGAWTCAEDIRWMGGGALLDFYAYYPYDDNGSDPEGLDPRSIVFHASTDQTGYDNGGLIEKPLQDLSDLLAAKADNNGSGYGRGTTVSLQFAHKMALVQVDISEKDTNVAPYRPDKLVVKLTGVKTGAVLDLGATGGPEAETDASSSETDIIMKRVEKIGDADYDMKFTYRAIVPAQPVESGARLFQFVQDADDDPLNVGTEDFDLSYRAERATELIPGRVAPYRIKLTYGDPDPEHKYKIGDWYPYAGKPTGVVFWLDTTHADYDPVTETGITGKIVSLDEFGPAVWGPMDLYMGATNQDNGRPNMNAISALSSWSTDFPGFYWAFAKNPEVIYFTEDAKGVWYLPAGNEWANGLQLLLGAGADAFNAVIEAAGGVPISETQGYWTSTESSPSIATARVYIGTPINSPFKSNEYYFRAIMEF